MHMKRWSVVIAMVGVLALVVACGSGAPDESTSTAVVEPDGDLATLPVDREMNVVMQDIAFKPSDLTGRVGEVIEVQFENEGVLLHDFTIDKMDADVMEMMGGSSNAGAEMHMDDDGADNAAMHMALDAGEEGRMRLHVHEPGTYTYYCTVPGHREAGMTGTLTIE